MNEVGKCIEAAVGAANRQLSGPSFLGVGCRVLGMNWQRPGGLC